MRPDAFKILNHYSRLSLNKIYDPRMNILTDYMKDLTIIKKERESVYLE